MNDPILLPSKLYDLAMKLRDECELSCDQHAWVEEFMEDLDNGLTVKLDRCHELIEMARQHNVEEI